MTQSTKPANQKNEKFKRDGARYVCVKCKAKYFTREDVEKCFDGHDANTPPNP
jgi:hypothetical protein